MSEPTTRQTPLRRYLRTNTTAANFVLSEGLLTAAEFGAVSIPFVGLQGFRGLPQISFFGTGADNSTLLWQLMMVQRIEDCPQGVLNGARAELSALSLVRKFASGTAVLCAAVGKDGGVIDDSERIADSVGTVTLTAWGTAMQSLFSSTPVTYNPADDASMAFYGIPDAGSVLGFFLDIKLGTATAGNGLYRLVT